MSKPVIAVDVDDVLAANAAGFLAFSNERWGTQLTIDDYSEHWTDMWQVDHDEAERRSAIFHASGAVRHFAHDLSAEKVLRKLAQSYTLVVITSRRLSIEKDTLAWLDEHFKGVFDKIHFAGIWDTEDTREARKQTKRDLCEKLGVQYLIDDHPKHCFAVADAGMTGLLFGAYKWNEHTGELPKNVVRVQDWQAVAEYFGVAG